MILIMMRVMMIILKQVPMLMDNHKEMLMVTPMMMRMIMMKMIMTQVMGKQGMLLLSSE